MENLEQFLLELKYSYHKNELIYTEGSCFRLYKMLKALFPKAKPFYSHLDGHWITEIDGQYWDINGKIYPSYVDDKNYEHITSEITLKSAYIPTYKRQCASYNKYI